MNQEQNIEQQLWAYIDGISTNEERSVVENCCKAILNGKTNIMSCLKYINDRLS
jgi:hypothetical protein